jgi:hypothetical protein
MTQALRVALWVPTDTPPDLKDVIATQGAPVGGVIKTAFEAPASGGGPGGGIPEAPNDGNLYARDGRSAAWVSLAVIDAGTF